MMSISALRTCLLSISLMGLLGGTSGFPNVKDTLELACDGFGDLDYARGTATKRLTGEEDQHLIAEIGAAMGKKADIYDGHLTQRTKVKKDASEYIRQYYQKRIWTKMGSLYMNLELGLSKDGTKAFHPLLLEAWKSLLEFSPKGDEEVKTTSEAEKLGIISPKGGEEIKTTPKADKYEDISLKGDEEIKTAFKEKELGILSNILVQFEKISAIGQDEKASDSYFRLSNIYSVIMNLSDTLVAHLAFSARYKFMRDDRLEVFLNDQFNLMITYNYFWGKFFQRHDITSLCLNLGIELGLQDIPFTKDMQDYFKFLNEDTRAELTRIKIAMQLLKPLGSQSVSDHDYAVEVLGLAKQFVHITSPETQPLGFFIDSTHSILALRIFKQIVKLSDGYGEQYEDLPRSIKFSLVLTQSLSFMKEKLPSSSWEEYQISFHDREKVDELQLAIQNFTSALRLVYSKYVRTIQDEASNLVLEKSRTQYRLPLSYLTPIFTKEEVSHYHMKQTTSDNKLCAKIIQQTQLILGKLETVEESGSRSIEQLNADKEKLIKILNNPTGFKS
ncbi:hypothetical protein MJO28_009450 [Puccinia striiformis f. sp. tritici]|uniref:Uncharacterized protein n=1 Tax=Puccinia striiformis f. sp. tritici TaxID=168172 RepID=A0ACC0E8K4_9BASI|nr:hypothetical protein MJO28_009450 [Puccinia striiformis f. sp. tritici]